ncbi:MAG: sugar phosphate isomerase/epimerase [Clostridia bacterium]|nr:sugar phosphate isomerase/epimerase [Clostridia bacterium]
MKLSTSHWLHYHIPGTDRTYTPMESLSAIREAGYDSVDINLWILCAPGAPLAVDTWEETVEAYRAASEALHLPVCQTHGNTMGGTEWDDPHYPHRDLQHITTLRCVEAARRLGAKYLVLHPFNLAHASIYSTAENRDACIAYLAPYIEAAKKAGIRIAVENMIDFGRRHRRYCAGDIYELIDLVDTIHDPDVGICLDTGHANISGLNVAAAIRAIGPRLICTHINDNHTKAGQDEHLLPYFGDIDWQSVMRALDEVHYGQRGDFTYEIKPQNVPDAARADWLRYTVKIGRHLLSQSKE